MRDYTILRARQMWNALFVVLAFLTFAGFTPAFAAVVNLRAITTTGSIAAGSNQLNLPANVGFKVGDFVIVEIGKEPGHGKRGTRGVGGTWPAKSYASEAAMAADNSQPAGLFAWIESTGDVWQWNAIVAGTWQKAYGYRGFYHFLQVIPRALQAHVNAVSADGKQLTLSRSASVSVSGANVYFDNAPILNALLADPGHSTPNCGVRDTNPATLVQLPAGNFAIGDVVQIGFKTNWTLAGQGKDQTRLFSPKGVSSTRLWAACSPGTVIKDLTLQGNFGDHGFGMSWHGGSSWYSARLQPPLVTETNTPHGPSFPPGIELYVSNDSVVQDVRVIDTFQKAVGAFYSNNAWAYRVESIQNSPVREYMGWLFHWSDTDGGGCVDCSVKSATTTTGFEGFKSKNTRFIRPVGTNAIINMNTAGGFLIEDAKLTFTPNSQHAEWPTTAAIGANSNIADQNAGNIPETAYLEQGGIIRNAQIIQEGYIDAAGSTYKGFTIGPGAPHIKIEGGIYLAPDYKVGAPCCGPLAVDSEGLHAVVDGFKVYGKSGRSTIGHPGYPSIWLRSGAVRNSVADVIWAPITENNKTPAEAGPPPTFTPTPPMEPAPAPASAPTLAPAPALALAPAPAPAPTPEPESTSGTRGARVVDAQGGVWTFDARRTLRNGAHAGGGWGTEYVYLGGVLYVLGTDSRWYRWLGARWEPASAPAPAPALAPASAPAPTSEPESTSGTRGARVVDAQGGVWTFDARRTLRNGAHTGGGWGTEYVYLGGVLYVLGTDSQWYRWSGARWEFFGASPIRS